MSQECSQASSWSNTYNSYIYGLLDPSELLEPPPSLLFFSRQTRATSWASSEAPYDDPILQTVDTISRDWSTDSAGLFTVCSSCLLMTASNSSIRSKLVAALSLKSASNVAKITNSTLSSAAAGLAAAANRPQSQPQRSSDISSLATVTATAALAERCWNL